MRDPGDESSTLWLLMPVLVLVGVVSAGLLGTGCGLALGLGIVWPQLTGPQRQAPVIVVVTATPASVLVVVTVTATPTGTPAPTATLLPTPTAARVQASPASRCVQASEQQILRIRTGVKGISEANDIKLAWAVKSQDFADVWMVAAKIYGPGMEDGTGPGVWAMNGTLDAPKLTFAVDGFAKEFSDWGDASVTDAAITSADDGVEEASACARNN